MTEDTEVHLEPRIPSKVFGWIMCIELKTQYSEIKETVAVVHILTNNTLTFIIGLFPVCKMDHWLRNWSNMRFQEFLVDIIFTAKKLINGIINLSKLLEVIRMWYTNPSTKDGGKQKVIAKGSYYKSFAA